MKDVDINLLEQRVTDLAFELGCSNNREWRDKKREAKQSLIRMAWDFLLILTTAFATYFLA